MTIPTIPDTDGRLAGLVRALREAPDMARYTDVFPRLEEKHLQFLGDVARTTPAEAATLLTTAGRREAPDLEDTIEVYDQRGELPALRVVAGADNVARSATKWQRKTDDLIRRVESFAALCDGEGVPCKVDLTWAKRINQVCESVWDNYADSPASQESLLQRSLAEMEQALEEFRQSMQNRLMQSKAELAQRQADLEERDASRAREYAESVAKLIAGNNLIPALRKLGLLEGLLSGRVIRSTNEGSQRLRHGSNRIECG